MTAGLVRPAIVTWLTVSTAVVPALARAAPADVHCDDTRIRVYGPIASRWLVSIAAACEHLASQADTDRSTSIRIVASGDDVVIEANTRTGRSATRRVRSPEHLAEVLEALLVVLPDAQGETAPAEPPAKAEASDAPVAAAKTAEHTEPSASFELSGAVTGRVAGPFVSVGPTITAGLVLGAWLIGIDARWDVDQRKANAPPGFEMQTVGAALVLSRRFRFGFGDLDAGLAPRLVVETQTIEDAKSEESYSATDVRLAGLARASFGHSALRFYTLLDTELAPGRLRRSLRLAAGLPALPSWSASLSVGLSWDVR